MTISFDVERYQRALERWRALAERRLEHMTVLYESGRWQRYFSEEQFIGVIRETRAAVDVWRKITPEHEMIATLFTKPDGPLVVRSRPQPEPVAAPPPATLAAAPPVQVAAAPPAPFAAAPPVQAAPSAQVAAPQPAPFAAPLPRSLAEQPPAPLPMPLPESDATPPPSTFTTPLPALQLSL